MFQPIKASHLSNFRKVHAANPWRVWLLMCFLMVQSVFAVMDHHPVLESSSRHFARHLLDIDQHGSHHHGESLDVETMDFAMMDFDFDSSQDGVDEDHSCDNHFHGIKLVTLPYSSLAVEIMPSIHERPDLFTSVRSAFPPPRYRPPIV